jgi:hypothetical protein
MLMSFSTAFTFLSVARGGVAASIRTDKGDYHPGETVIISGSGFNSEAQVTITVTRSDGSVSTLQVTSNKYGGFIATYELGAAFPSYTVNAADGTNTANTSFTDTPNIMALDGFNSAQNVNGTTQMVMYLTTTKSNDVLYLSFVGYGGATVRSITSLPVLTWTQRAGITANNDGSHYLQTYYAIKSSSGTVRITVTSSSSSNNQAIVAFGVSGANTNAPFDGNARTGSGTSAAAASVSITTSNANDFIIGALGQESANDPTKGKLFTLIRGQDAGTGRHVSTEYYIASTTQTALRVNYTGPSGADWSLVAEAVKQAPAITFTTSSMSDASSSETVLTLDGTSYTSSQLPKTFYWPSGSTHTVVASNVSSTVTGKQYRWNNWTSGDGLTRASGTYTVPSSDTTVTADYVTQYYLTVDSAYDTHGGAGWYDSGSIAHATLASDTVSGGVGIQDVFTGWSGDASGTGLTSNDITMNAAKTATAGCKTQYLVTYAASGNVLSVTVPAYEWVDSGASAVGAFPANVINVAGDTQCNFVSDDRPVSITAPTTITGSYSSSVVGQGIPLGNIAGVVLVLAGSSLVYPLILRRRKRARSVWQSWKHETIMVTGRAQSRYRDLKTGRFVKKPS